MLSLKPIALLQASSFNGGLHSVCRMVGCGGPTFGERLISALFFFFPIKEWNYWNAVFLGFYLPACWQQKYKTFLLLVLKKQDWSTHFVLPSPSTHAHQNTAVGLTSCSRPWTCSGWYRPLYFPSVSVSTCCAHAFRVCSCLGRKRSDFAGRAAWCGSGGVKMGRGAAALLWSPFCCQLPFSPFLAWTHRLA